jgi:hypothetical protein
MIRRFKFYKEEDNRWFVDLPEWEGEKDDHNESSEGYYNNDAWHGPSTIWLCSVTEFVFGKYPEKIYYK